MSWSYATSTSADTYLFLKLSTSYEKRFNSNFFKSRHICYRIFIVHGVHRFQRLVKARHHSPWCHFPMSWLAKIQQKVRHIQHGQRTVQERSKQILARAFVNPKRKLGVAKRFLEIIKQQLFQKTEKYKAMYGVFFQIEAVLPLKNAWLPQNYFFLGTKSTC